MSESAGAASAASTPIPAVNDTATQDTSAVEKTEVVETADESIEIPEVTAEAENQLAENKAREALKKRFKLKVDGEEFEEEIDLGDDESIKKHLQMSKAAQKRMQEKASIEKDMRQLLEILKNDPDAILAELGHDLDARAKNRLQKKLDELQKSPEQKQQEEYESKLKLAEEKAAKLEKEKSDIDFQRMQDKYRQQFDQELDNAFQGDPDLPKNSYTIKRVTDLMLFAMENNMPGVKIKDVLPIVKQEIYSEWNQMFDGFNEDQLEKAWGKKNIDRVRKAILKKQKQAPVTTTQAVVQTGKADIKTPEDRAKDRVAMKDFFRTIGSK